MQFVEAEDAAAQFVITEERLQIFAYGFYQAVVDRDRDIVAKERRFQGGRIIARARDRRPPSQNRKEPQRG